MKTYAYIQNGLVFEIIEPRTWDIEVTIVVPPTEEGAQPTVTVVHNVGDEIDIADRYTPDFVASCVLVPDSLVSEIAQNWTYNGAIFAAPVPPAIDYVAVNSPQRDSLMDVANAATLGMGDAFMLGLLDAADTATFKAWATYKLALSKVDLTQTEPTWPAPPA